MSGEDSHKCMSCGGMVDAEGMALGGMVGDEAPAIDNADIDTVTQDVAADEADRAARKAFVRAVKGKR